MIPLIRAILNIDGFVKSLKTSFGVIPAKAGIQCFQIGLDACLRRHDGITDILGVCQYSIPVYPGLVLAIKHASVSGEKYSLPIFCNFPTPHQMIFTDFYKLLFGAPAAEFIQRTLLPETAADGLSQTFRHLLFVLDHLI